MKTRPRFVLALGLAAVLAAGVLVAVGRPPADAQEQKAEAKEQPARGRREAFIAAFNKGNAKAVAADHRLERVTAVPNSTVARIVLPGRTGVRRCGGLPHDRRPF